MRVHESSLSIKLRAYPDTYCTIIDGIIIQTVTWEYIPNTHLCGIDAVGGQQLVWLGQQVSSREPQEPATPVAFHYLAAYNYLMPYQFLPFANVALHYQPPNTCAGCAPPLRLLQLTGLY